MWYVAATSISRTGASTYQRALASSPNVEDGPIRMDQKLWPRRWITSITLAEQPDNVTRMPEPEKQLI